MASEHGHTRVLLISGNCLRMLDGQKDGGHAQPGCGMIDTQRNLVAREKS